MRAHSMIMWRTKVGIFGRAGLAVLPGIFVVAFLLAAARPAGAQMASLGGYEISSFVSDITVNADASLSVVERIEGSFLEPRHGLFRKIPVEYVGDDGARFTTPLRVTSVKRNDQPEPFSVLRSGAEKVIKIGDADRFVDGPFVYTIAYRVERAVLTIGEEREVYWNATGTGWDVLMPNVRAAVHVSGARANDFKMACYTGFQGSSDQACAWAAEDGSAAASASDFLTIAVRFPKGLIAGPSSWQEFAWWARDHADRLFWLIPIVTAILLFRYWKKEGRSPKGRGTIIAEYDPPDQLRPTEVGLLVDARVHRRDLSAAFVDLAVRGYVRILEEEEKIMGVFVERTYTLEKQKDGTGLKPYEQEIFSALFARGNKKVLRTTDAKMAEAIAQATDHAYAGMTTDGYFVRNPRKIFWAFMGPAIGMISILSFLFPALLAMTGRFDAAAAFFLTAVFLGFSAFVMRSRTQKGVLAHEQALGFKLFLETAEQYRLQWQEREGIFEKFLPYAMVFGVTDKWAKAFQGINLPEPAWYAGPHSGLLFSPTDFGKQMGSFTAAASAAQAPTSKSRGGGGGFSGGGFGGGGGGSW